ncbi:hypothetical protein LB516_03500 [Mesorhizobium sp. CO1-1-7]|uniref:hypothetical protein n=1 Tax=Mesorhizobium sp. CO1-1-7 TaxID=2876632 RepID=UPI001CD08B02|nr:hypothetical protein [Mesorhizobium sp. CO1-1-7]MBZ9744309.1 hypothetical protein [Mesorhizobium sp. CO1-1-7]
MTDHFDSEVLLSIADLQKRKKDLQEWQAEITSLQKQVAETLAWLNLVAKLIGPERASQLLGDVLLPAQVSTSNAAILPPEPHPGRSAMGDEVKQFLKTQANGATSRQIIDHLLQTQEFQEGVQRNSNSVYMLLSRLVKRHELLKIESRYYSPVARPNETGGSEVETVVLKESRGARLSSPAGRDAEPTHADVDRDRDASASGPQTSTDYVGRDPAAVPPEVPPAQPPPITSSAITSSATKSLFQTESAAAPPEVSSAQPTPITSPPTKSLFQTESAAAPPQVSSAQPTPITSPPTKSLFQIDSAAAPPERQFQPLDFSRED